MVPKSQVQGKDSLTMANAEGLCARVPALTWPPGMSEIH
jgi:hypothetical protein